MQKRSKSILSFVVKLLLTILAFYLTFRNLDAGEVAEVFAKINYVYLSVALVLFFIAKYIEAFRQNIYYKDVAIQLSNLENFKLYLLGMFYNLFLPGGIGGDAYKVYWIKNKSTVDLREIVRATLVNRINGLFVLITILTASVFLISLDFPYKNYVPGLTILWVLGFYIFIRIFFKKHLKSSLNTSICSFFVHFAQTLSVIMILYAIGISTGLFDYWYVFMVSNIAVVLPISIGGFGVRELVFKEAASQLNMNMAFAVSVGLVFNLIRSFVSFVGLYYLVYPDRITDNQ